MVIWNAILNKKPIDSKLVTCKTIQTVNLINAYSEIHWYSVASVLNTKKYNPDHFKSNFSHLMIQPIYPGDVTLIMRTEFSNFLLNEEYREERKVDPYTKTYLGCVFLWLIIKNLKQMSVLITLKYLIWKAFKK